MRLSHAPSIGPFNSLAPGRSSCDFKNLIFNLALLIGIFKSSSENILRWMPQDLTDDKSTLVQVMAWCRQATSHYQKQCWPRSPKPYDIQSQMASLDPNELTNMLWAWNQNRVWRNVAFTLKNHDQIKSQFCTCHGSCMIMTYGKLWNNYTVKINIRAKINFTRFQLLTLSAISELGAWCQPGQVLSWFLEIINWKHQQEVIFFGLLCSKYFDL